MTKAKELVKVEDPARALSLRADSAVKLAVSSFGEYTDSTGAKSSGPKGVMMQINKEVKACFGLSRDDMTPGMLMHLYAILDRIVLVINQGMERMETRRAIKDGIRAAIRRGADAYFSAEGGLHGRT